MTKKHTLGDAPIEKQYYEQMVDLAGFLDMQLNGQMGGEGRKNGFVLLVFPFGDNPKSRCNFISNGADRKDIVALFKEMIARFEGQPESKGGRA